MELKTKQIMKSEESSLVKEMKMEIHQTRQNRSQTMTEISFRGIIKFSTSDANYHGHLNQRLGNTGTTTNPEQQDKVTERIKSKVADINNVQQVRSVLYGNSVMVSVKLANGNRAEETRRAIQDAVKPLAGGRSVQVIFDDGALGREGNRNNDSQRLEPNSRKQQ